MCEYCNLVSGDEKEIEEGYGVGLYLERHNNTYNLIALCHEDIVEKKIYYCPMCR